jgi:hypothetical protein
MQQPSALPRPGSFRKTFLKFFAMIIKKKATRFHSSFARKQREVELLLACS